MLFDVNKDLVELMRSDGIYRGSVSRVEEISNIQSNNNTEINIDADVNIEFFNNFHLKFVENVWMDMI